MKNIYTTILFLLSLAVSGQDVNQNWVKKTTYKKEKTTQSSDPTEVSVNVSYLDGLGRPVQQIANKQSAVSGSDVSTYISYDEYGRQTKQYLPYPTGTTTMDFNDNPDASLTYAPYVDNKPFSETAFDPAVPNRVEKIAAPGKITDWAMDSNHEIAFDYSPNYDDMRFFTITGGIPADALYPFFLSHKQVIDENHTATEEYVNSKGLLYLKRAYAGSEALNTYYIYDEFDNLAFVIPPKADGEITEDILNDLCYQYKYDQYQRLIEKKLPGRQPEYIIYDKLNRIIATGPAFDPLANADNLPVAQGWLRTYYDPLGRVAITGWEEESADFATASTALQNNNNGGVTAISRSTTVNNINGVNANYDGTIFSSHFFVLTVNYYDDYNFPHETINFSTAVAEQLPYFNNTIRPVGLPTGSWSRVLDPTVVTVLGETTYVLYDRWAKAIATYKMNHLGGYTETATKIDFAGIPEYTITSHKRDHLATAIILADEFAYSDQGQLLKHTQKILPTGDKMVLAQNTYNEMGQLVSKIVGDVDGMGGLQEINYKYNIRGWLTDINDVTDMSEGDLFAFKINYDQIGIGGDYTENEDGVSGLYNGNISETFWRSASDDVLRRYGYIYDSANRMEMAIYTKSDTNIATNSYNEEVVYDKGGNITAIARNGNLDNVGTVQTIDNLSYRYADNSNKLEMVYDYTNSPLGFKDNPGATEEDVDYDYDKSGNLIKDSNKGITRITYNHLNLPTTIIVGDKRLIYIYNANGEKLTKINVQASTRRNTDYLDGFQYYAGKLKFFACDGGYVSNTIISDVNHFNYVYNYTDHLGNIRLSYGLDENQELKILEENHYYAYGLKHANYNSTLRSFQKNEAETGVVLRGAPPVQEVDNSIYKYKFNGQEWQDELGLNMTAMDFRQYDNAIGRFVGMDALSEINYSQSPYHFANNNPVYFADPTGLDDIYIDINWDTVQSGTTITPLYTQNDINNASGDLYLFDQNSGELTYSNSLPAVSVGFNFSTGQYSSNAGTTIQNHVYNNSPYYQGGGEGFGMSSAFAFAGAASLADGPLPFGEIAGAVVITGTLAYVYGPPLVAKMTKEIEGIRLRQSGPAGFQYALTATRAGEYPNVRGGTSFLNVGDVWKYGETTSSSRYSKSYLDAMGLRMLPQFFGNQLEIKVQEKVMIYGYFFGNGSLPPGNSIFR